MTNSQPTDKDRTRVIRKAISNVYGIKQTSVRQGTGRACGWIYMTVDVLEEWRVKTKEETREQIENLARKALSKIGAKFDTFYGDDGYDTEHECFMLKLNYI